REPDFRCGKVASEARSGNPRRHRRYAQDRGFPPRRQRDSREHLLCQGVEMTLAMQTLRELYAMMYLIRRAEEMLMAEYHPADQMRCPIHFCVGQEAMPAALSGQLRPADVLMSHYRSHGYYLAKG